MRSATSYFNFTLFRKNLSRFWPIWGLYGLIWLVLLPIGLLTDGDYLTLARARLIPLQYLDGMSTALFLAAGFGILCAMAVFSYLYSSRSVGLLHALPMRREGLFLTNYLSGLAFLVLPNLAVFFLSLLVEAAFGVVVFSSLFVWLVTTCFYCLFFYSFAVFCAMFTGHILALPAFYGILNFLVMGLCFLVNDMAQRFLFGFTGAAWMETLGLYLTPVAYLASGVRVSYYDGPAPSYDQVAFLSGLGRVFLVGLIGLVLAALALAVYRRRQLETAGDVVSVAWVRPVFRYGVAFCCAIALGNLFDNIFDRLLPDGAWTLLFWMLLWGAFGCFVAVMLLRKTFWVFKSSWKGCCVFLACLAAAMCLMELDGFGFESRVPDPARVQTAYVVNVRTCPSDDAGWVRLTADDPETIALVTQLHRQIVSEKARLEDDRNVYVSNYTTDADGVDVQTEDWKDVRLSYVMTDGDVMYRDYTVPVTGEELAEEGSISALLQALFNAPGFAEEAYFGSLAEGDRLVAAEVSGVFSGDQTLSENLTLPSQALPDLEAAVRADLAAGDLGRRWLLEDGEYLDGCYDAYLYLTYRLADREGSNSMEVTDAPAGTAVPYTEASGGDYATVTIALQPGASRTLALLEELAGIGPDQELTLRTLRQVSVHDQALTG